MVFDGLVSHTDLASRRNTKPSTPISYQEHIDKKARVYLEAVRKHYGKFKGAGASSVNDYDATKDDIKAVDLTGANAVKLNQFRSKQSKDGVWASFSQSLERKTIELTDEERLYKMNEMVLTEFQYQPFIFQKRFLKIIMRCVAQLIVGEETWNRRGAAIMKHFGWETIGTMAIATSFRRGGKTQIVCYALAGACLTKSLVAGFFSTAKRASDGARNTFIKALQTSEYAHCLPAIGLKAEILYIAAIYDAPGSVSAISFYPANPRIRTFTLSHPLSSCVELVLLLVTMVMVVVSIEGVKLSGGWWVNWGFWTTGKHTPPTVPRDYHQAFAMCEDTQCSRTWSPCTCPLTFVVVTNVNYGAMW